MCVAQVMISQLPFMLVYLVNRSVLSFRFSDTRGSLGYLIDMVLVLASSVWCRETPLYRLYRFITFCVHMCRGSTLAGENLAYLLFPKLSHSSLIKGHITLTMFFLIFNSTEQAKVIQGTLFFFFFSFDFYSLSP